MFKYQLKTYLIKKLNTKYTFIGNCEYYGICYA